MMKQLGFVGACSWVRSAWFVLLCSAANAATGDFPWHYVSPTPTGNEITRVTFLNGQFFVVGNSGTLLTSTDGMTWEQKLLPDTYHVADVAYGNGRYVVSNGRSGIYSSTNAVDWTTVRPSVYYYWAGGRDALLAYGNGIFVRVMSQSSAVPTNTDISSNGITWQPVEFPNFYGIPTSLVFAEGRFVLSFGSGAVWSTVDGGHWVPVATGAAPTDAALAAGHGIFVLALAEAPCLRSLDGLNWATADRAPVLSHVTFLNDRFLGRDGSSGAVIQSTDGVTWTNFTAPAETTAQLFRAAYGNGVYVGINSSMPAQLVRSTDGVTWANVHRSAPFAPAPGAPIVFGNGVFLAPGARSLDGVNWNADTFVTTGSDTNPTRSYFCRDRFIVFQNHAFFVSIDGRTGRTVFTPSDPTETFGPPIFALNKFLIPSAQGALVSTDGETWTRDTALKTLTGVVAFGNGLFVRCAERSIETSVDAITWTARYTLPSEAPPNSEYRYQLGTPLYGNGHFVVSGSWRNSHGYTGDFLVASSDGLAWSLADILHGFNALTFVNGVFVSQSLPELAGRAAPHASSHLAGPLFNISLDGENWHSYPFPSDNVVTSFAGNNEVFEASTAGGLLATHFPLPSLPSISSLPLTGSPNLRHGEQVKITANATGAPPFTYQWRRNGVAIAGATSAGYFAAGAGSYDVVVTNATGSVTSAAVAVTMNDSWLANVSSRAFVGTGEDVLIQGFVVQGPSSLQVLARGVGPTLAAMGVGETLVDPGLRLHRSSNGELIAENDNWSSSGEDWLSGIFRQFGAFALPSGSKDAAVAIWLTQGAYTFPISGGGGTGVALSELYDTGGTARIVNLSARARTGSAERTLIAGFVIGGNQPLKLLIRAVGPTLNSQGVAQPLSNPKLWLFNSAGVEIHNNDNWGDAANVAAIRATATAVGAFALREGSYDSAMVETLDPGVYTVHVTSADGTSTGVALAEIYAAP